MHQYFGSKVSLVTNDDVLYEGILYAIHNEKNIISLKEVYHMKSDGVPANPTAASFQLFKASDVRQIFLHQNNHQTFNLNNDVLLPLQVQQQQQQHQQHQRRQQLNVHSPAYHPQQQQFANVQQPQYMRNANNMQQSAYNTHQNLNQSPYNSQFPHMYNNNVRPPSLYNPNNNYSYDNPPISPYNNTTNFPPSTHKPPAVPSLQQPPDAALPDPLHILSLNPLPHLNEQHVQDIITFSTSTVDLTELEDREFDDLDDYDDIDALHDLDATLADKWTLDDIVEIAPEEEVTKLPELRDQTPPLQMPQTAPPMHVQPPIAAAAPLNFTQLIDEDMDKISKYIESVALPSDTLQRYKAQLEKLKATKIQYEAWWKKQMATTQSMAPQMALSRHLNPFDGLDDVLGGEYNKDSEQNTVKIQNMPHINHGNGVIVHGNEESNKLLDAPTSTYFGFVSVNNLCADYQVSSDEVLISLSGYKFHGGARLKMTENGTQTVITHTGNDSVKEYAPHTMLHGMKRKVMRYEEYEKYERSEEWNSCYGSFFIRSAHKNKICIRINCVNKNESGYGICIGIVDGERDFAESFHFGDRECYGFRSDGIQYVNGKLVGKWDEYCSGDVIVLLVYNNTIKWLVNNVIKCIQYNIVPSRKYRLGISVCGRGNSVSILSASKIENAQSVMKKKKKNKKKKKKQKKKKKKKKLMELKKRLEEIQNDVALGIESSDELEEYEEFDVEEDCDEEEEEEDGNKTGDGEQCAPPEDEKQRRRLGKIAMQRRAEEIKNKIKILTKKQLSSGKKASKIRYNVGDKVRLKNGNIGMIRFSHKTFFSNNQTMYGVELLEWNPNGHRGEYEDIAYFRCDEGHGFFAKSDFIISKIVDRSAMYSTATGLEAGHCSNGMEEVDQQKQLASFLREVDNIKNAQDVTLTMDKINEMMKEGTPPDFGGKEDGNININGYTLSDVHFGNRVLLTNGLAGSIRFMGKVDFDDSIWLGIDLKKKNCNGNYGSTGGRKYFEPKEGCGYFIKMNEIERILPSKSIKKKKKKKKKKRKCLKNFPKLGDKVKTVNGRVGVVEFIGVICLVKDICIGLTLDKVWPHGNDGSVKGKRYFSCESGRGYFVRLQHLVQNVGSTLGKDGQQKALEMGKSVNINNAPIVAEATLQSAEAMELEKKKEIIKFKNGLFQQGYYRIMEKLKEIDMLEDRRRCGFFLFPTQFKKMEKKEEYLASIEEIKTGTWTPPKIVKKENEADAKEADDDEDGDGEDDDDPFIALDHVLGFGYSVVAETK